MRKADALLRKIMGSYCFSASVSSFALLAYYYIPDLFTLFDILLPVSAIFSMVIFYHFFHYATKPGVRFSTLHYIIPSLLFVVLTVIKLLFPEVWIQEGVHASLIAALLFGIVYSLLPLAGMQRYQMEKMAAQGKSYSINLLQATLYVTEVFLFPVVFVFFPLIGGQTPGILTTSLLMICILLALKANIPFTYAVIRHHISLDALSHSFFDETSEQRMNINSNVEEESGKVDISERNEVSPKDEIPKKSNRELKNSLPPGFDKKMFNSFIRRHKPYLNPNLTINDVAKMLDSNRTYISEFVNKAYKMNFSSYINLCRLREMNRLLGWQKNSGKTPRELISQTGFGTLRNYLRAKRQFGRQAEEAGSNDN